MLVPLKAEYGFVSKDALCCKLAVANPGRLMPSQVDIQHATWVPKYMDNVWKEVLILLLGFIRQVLSQDSKIRLQPEVCIEMKVGISNTDAGNQPKVKPLIPQLPLNPLWQKICLGGRVLGWLHTTILLRLILSQKQSPGACECRVTVLEEELGRMSPDLGAIEAYRQKDADYKTRVQELERATEERDEVIALTPIWNWFLGQASFLQCVLNIAPLPFPCGVFELKAVPLSYQ